MVNVQTDHVYFCAVTKVDSLIAQQLIDNMFLIVEESPRKCHNWGEAAHCLVAGEMQDKISNMVKQVQASVCVWSYY